jgi:phosphoribosylformylglycinamidine synthase
VFLIRRARRSSDHCTPSASRDSAEAQIREMCDKLLANPVIEDYRFEISPEL